MVSVDVKHHVYWRSLNGIDYIHVHLVLSAGARGTRFYNADVANCQVTQQHRVVAAGVRGGTVPLRKLPQAHDVSVCC